MAASQNELNIQKWKYDTFLSYRADDSRDNFVGPLRKRLEDIGISVFKDDTKVERGKPILTELFKAIEESRCAVIVFSETYASSTWCLEELTKIIEYVEKKRQKVWLVFHNVEPTDVWMQRNSIAESLVRLEADLLKGCTDDLEKLPRWKDALCKALNFAGPDPRTTANGDETKCIELIVKEIYRSVEGGASTVVKYQLGIESRVNKVKSLLKVGLDGVRFVGIRGRGGIGKTTVARDIFNRICGQFEGSCFLANVGAGVSNEHEPESLKYLQESLLFQIFKQNEVRVTSVDEGRKMIRAMLSSRKVLIVLDDVDDNKQLECLVGGCDWFGDGSRIITTTRNGDLLSNHDELYHVPDLAFDEALELFCRYAFQQVTPQKEFEKISCDVVNYASGLPLALEILGTLLHKRGIREWINALEKLKDIGDKNMVKQLSLSLDGLDEEDKTIFLYIACFYRGKRKDDVITILNKFGFKSEIGIKFLAKKLLLYISKGRIEMHDLIEQMGQQVARDGDQDTLWNLCRHSYINAIFLANQISRAKFPVAFQDETVKKWEYDVFLSFRGEDTRRNFTSSLYKRIKDVGINAFVDEADIARGAEIKTGLLKGIEQSRIAIIIFSKGYASSRFCLDELAMIMECLNNNKGKTVFPVFIDIEPSDVRKQRNRVAKALASLEGRYPSSDCEKLGRWKEALHNAANIAGWDVPKTANGDFEECIELIVNQVSRSVNAT